MPVPAPWLSCLHGIFFVQSGSAGFASSPCLWQPFAPFSSTARSSYCAEFCDHSPRCVELCLQPRVVLAAASVLAALVLVAASVLAALVFVAATVLAALVFLAATVLAALVLVAASVLAALVLAALVQLPYVLVASVQDAFVVAVVAAIALGIPGLSASTADLYSSPFGSGRCVDLAVVFCVASIFPEAFVVEL